MPIDINKNTLTPIFIHSLFRAGSTYLFMVFRRSSAGYWCYQEPLHEMAFFARNKPESLINGFGEAEMQLNRHPQMDSPYFKELFEVWPVWQTKISYSSVYESYFAPPRVDIGIAYWQTLIDASKGRHVFQECRTSGRIGAIKESLGGYHLYLWRNSWDQWWSLKINPYFDTVNQLIIRAPNAPTPVRLLRCTLGLGECPSDFAQALAYFEVRPPSSENSYLIFYMLWCLGLHEGMMHANLMLSIDRLSDSLAYRSEIQNVLVSAGISGIDFSDCYVPQGLYLEQDREFFEPLENQVHQWLMEGGWSRDQLDDLQAIRQQYKPSCWGAPITTFEPKDLAEQASRARSLARRFETHFAENMTSLTKIIGLAEAKSEQAGTVSKEHLAQLDADYASTSWHIAHSSRYARVLLRLRSMNFALGARMKAWLRSRLAYGVYWVVQRVQKSAHLRRFAFGLLHRFPAMGIRLRCIYLQLRFRSQSVVLNKHEMPVGFVLNPNLARSNDVNALVVGGLMYEPISKGVNADQRTPLEENFLQYRGRQ